MTIAIRSGFTTRPYQDRDEEEVLDLLRASLVTGPTGPINRNLFHWKHLNSPFGRSFMLVAESGGHIVGLRAFMRWEFHAGDRCMRAVRAVDTATHPKFQRMGMFKQLTLEAIDALAAEIDFVFNTPNDKSLPGYLKMGWQRVGRITVAVRVRRPLRFARALPTLGKDAGGGEPRPVTDARKASEVLEGAHGLEDLLEGLEYDSPLLSTRRRLGYLRWRYGAAPLLDYRAVCETDERGRITGLAIFRVRPRGRLWESTIAELLVPDHETDVARRLLRRVGRAAKVDHLTCHFPTGSVSNGAAIACGYLRSPMGLMLVANAVKGGIEPDPARMTSWGLSLGDVEVF